MWPFTGDEKLDMSACQAWPGPWETLEISSEKARAQLSSYSCAHKIAAAAKYASFPVIVGVNTNEIATTTDRERWTCQIRVAWPAGKDITPIVTGQILYECDLGSFAVNQGAYDNFHKALKYCQLGKTWRCNFNAKP